MADARTRELIALIKEEQEELRQKLNDFKVIYGHLFHLDPNPQVEVYLRDSFASAHVDPHVESLDDKQLLDRLHNLYERLNKLDTYLQDSMPTQWPEPFRVQVVVEITQVTMEWRSPIEHLAQVAEQSPFKEELQPIYQAIQEVQQRDSSTEMLAKLYAIAAHAINLSNVENRNASEMAKEIKIMSDFCKQFDREAILHKAVAAMWKLIGAVVKHIPGLRQEVEKRQQEAKELAAANTKVGVTMRLFQQFRKPVPEKVASNASPDDQQTPRRGNR